MGGGGGEGGWMGVGGGWVGGSAEWGCGWVWGADVGYVSVCGRRCVYGCGVYNMRAYVCLCACMHVFMCDLDVVGLSHLFAYTHI